MNIYINYEDIIIHENEDGVDFGVTATDELIEIVNEMRKKKGERDLVGWEFENDVYYNFYLNVFLPYEDITLIAVPYGSERDEGCLYFPHLTEEDKKEISYKVIAALLKNIK